MYAYLKNTQVSHVSESNEECVKMLKGDNSKVFSKIAKEHSLNLDEEEDLIAAYRIIKEDSLIPVSSYVVELEDFDVDNEDWEMETEEGDAISYFEIMLLL